MLCWFAYFFLNGDFMWQQAKYDLYQREKKVTVNKYFMNQLIAYCFQFFNIKGE